MAHKRTKNKGDTAWFMDGRKTPIAWSTSATSDLLTIYAEDGSTWRQIFGKINYDRDAKAICEAYIARGHGDVHPILGPLLSEAKFATWWPGKREAVLDSDCLIGQERAPINRRRHGEARQ